MTTMPAVPVDMTALLDELDETLSFHEGEIPDQIAACARGALNPQDVDGDPYFVGRAVGVLEGASTVARLTVDEVLKLLQQHRELRAA